MVYIAADALGRMGAPFPDSGDGNARGIYDKAKQ
jgi:hypothetical protein